MKTGKEIKFNNFKDYKIVFGSVNNKRPKAMYVNISAWADPIHVEGVNYNRVIREINKNIKQTLYSYLSSSDEPEFLYDRTIVDLDIRESGIRYGKRSFINCEVTLYMTDEMSVISEDMQVIIDGVISKIIKNVFDKNKYFKFHKKKH